MSAAVRLLAFAAGAGCAAGMVALLVLGLLAGARARRDERRARR